MAGYKPSLQRQQREREREKQRERERQTDRERGRDRQTERGKPQIASKHHTERTLKFAIPTTEFCIPWRNGSRHTLNQKACFRMDVLPQK
jgi:hypothetical protein